MATENSTGYRTFTATATAISANRVVQHDSSGNISLAGADNDNIGVLAEDVAASGKGLVKLWSAPGTFLVSAAGAVTKNAKVYVNSAGRASTTLITEGAFIGRSLDTAASEGDVIEITPGLPHRAI